MTDVIGWPLPIDALPRWLFLQPDPRYSFQYRVNEAGQLDAIRQHGWQINYKNYRDYKWNVVATNPCRQKQFNEIELGLVLSNNHQGMAAVSLALSDQVPFDDPSYSWFAPAKINLFLHVVGKRDDGYHELQTLFQLLDYGDYLRFSLNTKGVIKRNYDLGFDQNEDLCLRAANLIKPYAKDHSGCHD